MKTFVASKLMRSGIIGSSLLCSLSFAVGAQQETAEQFVERVKQAIKNDEWGRAKSGIRHALGLKPESAEANFVAAQVYWHEGARSMAIDALNKLGHGLDERAEQAASKLKFAPATENGKEVPYWMKLSFEFGLK